MPDFSLAEWKRYCEEKVRPQHTHDREQMLRLERLLSAANIGNTWRNFAVDLKPLPPHLPQTWQEALHEVIGVLIFPPTPIDKTDPATQRYLRWLRRSGDTRRPLLVGGRGKKNDEGRWIALYLKTWIVPAFFARRHHDDIAALVNAGLELADPLSADDVRKLRPASVRSRQRNG
jgi:hypothetical protein